MSWLQLVRASLNAYTNMEIFESNVSLNMLVSILIFCKVNLAKCFKQPILISVFMHTFECERYMCFYVLSYETFSLMSKCPLKCSGK